MRVSIIIPCYNVAPYLDRALQSALSQTYRDTEIICVDNNSTDDTGQILTSYHARYPQRIKVLSEARQGAPAARNLGLRNATGNWIQFLDADDDLLPDKLERQLQLVEQNKAVWLIGTATYMDLTGAASTLVAWDDPWLGLAHGMYAGNTVANLYRKGMLVEIGGWDKTLPYLQDLNLVFRVLQRSGDFVLDKSSSCLCYDRPSGKITQQNPAGMYAAAIHFGNEINTWLQANRPEYWQLHQRAFQTALLRKVKLLATHDIDQAMTLAREYLPAGFVPPLRNDFGFAAWHQIAYPLLGLERTERWKQALLQRLRKP